MQPWRISAVRFVGAAPLWTLAGLAVVAALVVAALRLSGTLPALTPPALGPAKPATDQALADARQEEGDLRLYLNALLRELGRRLADCAPEEPEAPPEAPPQTPAPPQEGRAPDPEQDSTFDSRLEREGAGRGPVTVSLIWQTRDDLDLFVRCPNGDLISYESMRACGGVLDVDMNFRRKISAEPVENVTWTRTPPDGTYQVAVGHAQRRSPGRGPVPFSVRVKIGDKVTVVDGRVRPGQAKDVTTFTITPEGDLSPGGAPPPRRGGALPGGGDKPGGGGQP